MDCSEKLNGILLLVPDLECLSGGLQQIRKLQIRYSKQVTLLLLSHLLPQLEHKFTHALGNEFLPMACLQPTKMRLLHAVLLRCRR
jgi:hypothetical protein